MWFLIGYLAGCFATLAAMMLGRIMKDPDL